MNEFKKSHCHWQLRYAPLLVLFLSNCGQGVNFGGERDNSSHTIEDKGEDLSDEDGQEPASEPAEVTGAFLTCSNSLPDVSKNNVYGCGVYKNEQKLNLDTDDLTWKAFDNDQVEVEIHRMRDETTAENPWHIVFESAVKLSKISVVIPESKDSEDHKETKAETLEWNTFVDLEGKALSVELGGEIAFHIGDDKNYQSSCKEGIESVDHFGKIIKFKIVLETASSINLTMEGICGVDSYYKNTIQLLSESQEVIFSDYLNVKPEFKNGYDFKSSKFLEAGTYYLKLETKLWDKDYDDFVVKKLKIESTSKVTLSQVPL